MKSCATRRWAGGAGSAAKLFTCSYDGSVRALDPAAGVFELVHTDEDAGAASYPDLRHNSTAQVAQDARHTRSSCIWSVASLQLRCPAFSFALRHGCVTRCRRVLGVRLLRGRQHVLLR